VTSSLELSALTDRSSARSQIIDALRAALVAGQMKPGEIYSAPTLAASFGVSATPVREAMLELAKEGLVTTVPNKGFRVRELSERELDEITEIRLLLEVPTTVSVIGIATEGDLARLRPMAGRIVDLARDKDLIGYLEHDRQFHLTLLGLGGNTHLVNIVARSPRVASSPSRPSNTSTCSTSSPPGTGPRSRT
jgi:DNA-binding GntR family transcriptional regulator